jgi:hypothetical protein
MHIHRSTEHQGAIRPAPMVIRSTGSDSAPVRRIRQGQTGTEQDDAALQAQFADIADAQSADVKRPRRCS